jgi:hypothetical protein
VDVRAELVEPWLAVAIAESGKGLLSMPRLDERDELAQVVHHELPVSVRCLHVLKLRRIIGDEAS